MEKEILLQYTDVKAEVKDIRRRIDKLKRELDNMDEVADSVTGTRPDGTIGTIQISGFPEPEYYKKKALLGKYKKKLQLKEIELLETMNQTEEFIESLEKSELRTIFRLFFIDDLNYIQVAHRMNILYPKREKAYTDESIRKKIERFFQNVRNVRF